MKNEQTNSAPGVDGFQLEILKNLVAFNTCYPPGNEEAAARYLAGILEPMGFAAEVQEVRPGRANLVARLRGGEGPEVVFNGHLDVVAADASQWRSDPFVMREDGGFLYGRGVCDMKGAISCMIGAARDFIASGRVPKGTLTLLFVVDEEVNALGSRHFAETNPKPDVVIIGEPTGMNVHVAHRGDVRYHLEITGKSGHSARPGLALNPIGVAAELVRRIDMRNVELSRVEHPVLPPPSIAATMVSAGEQPNVIPGRCRLTVDRRTLPGEGEEEVRAEAEEMRKSLPARFSGTVGEPEIFVSVRAGELRAGSGLAGECVGLLRGMGIEAEVQPFPVGCDQFVFTGMGVDCVLVGPGDIGNAHCVDEFVGIGELGSARNFYRAFMESRL